ncbi:MAG TPA: MMPL family transporter [Kofleriaceae bacterium]|nr:MMPL family transporter [Kofleriaceae bacterium]
MTRRRARAASLIVMLGTALGFAAAVPHMRFTTQITEFLPDDSANRGAQIAALLAESEFARIMVIDLSMATAQPAPELGALTRELLAFLRGQPDVAVARSGFTEDDVAQVLAFLEAWPATTFLPRDAYADDALRARLAELRDQLASPLGVVVRRTAPRDPLGGLWEPVRALREARGSSLVDDDGIVFTQDHRHAFAFVETRSSPFDSDAQRQFRAVLDGWLARAPRGVQMQTAGTAQFAIASEAQIKDDVNRIGTVSTIGIVAIFLVLFGSVRMILLGFVPMLFGSAVAVLACEAVFGEIHGITIAFGTSLLGVGLDYVEHYYAHFVLTEAPAEATMRHVAPSLVAGALTTILGFIGIGASGLAGLRQMAVFSVIAIVASMAATYWVVPPWMPARYRPPRSLGVVNRGALAVLVRVTRRRWGRHWRAALLGLAVAGTAISACAARFSDNVNMLVSDRGAHVADDRAVRARLGPEWSCFAVITATSDDALLDAIARTTGELAGARAAGLVASFVPLDRLLPSRAEQLARFAAAQAAAPRIRRALAELDFVPDQFAPFWDALAGPAPPILTLADVRRSPLAPLLAAWVPAQATPIALIPLIGATDLDALRARVPSAAIIAPAQTIVELFRGVRIQTVIASLVGLAAIFGLLMGRYRSARKSLVALAPGLLACVATVGALVAAGVALNILHVMSLLLVVSMGVDFGIFLVDTTDTLEESARTLVSILTASLTTILSFGLLGLSDSPGLAALGVTVTLGTALSLVFCVVMAALAGPRVAAGAA